VGNSAQSPVASLADWDPRDTYDETLQFLASNDERAEKERARAILFRAVFSTPGGREALDHLIAAYLMGPHMDITADRALGREDVVKEILKQFYIAERLQDHG